MKWLDYFYYDETSPTCLRWSVSRYRFGNGVEFIKPGDIAGSFAKRKNGKIVSTNVKLDGKNYGVNRIIWEIFNGTIPSGMVIDHLNRNPKDNRIENLACKTYAGNARNTSLYATNKTGVTGVSYEKQASGHEYFSVTWRGLDGKNYKKAFSCLKLGKENAFKEACAYREEKMRLLEELGAGYTTTHGK